MECRIGTRTRVGRTEGFEKKRSEKRESRSEASAASFLFQSDVSVSRISFTVNLASELTISCCRLHDAALGRSAADCGRVEMTMARWHMRSTTCTPGYGYWPPLQVAHVMCALAPHRGRGRRPLCSCAALQSPIGRWRPVLPEFSSVFRCVVSGVDDDNAWRRIKG